MLALLLTWPVVLNQLANDIDIQQIYGEIGSDTSGVNESKYQTNLLVYLRTIIT